MLIQTADVSANQLYHMMIQTIIPRPIAWVLSENKDSGYNLAPFSYFNGVSSDPPVLMISAGKKKTGEKKDTWVNIEERKHFVVHIASLEHMNSVEKSAEPLAYGDSELSHSNLEVASVDGWNLPRLKKAKVAFYCEKFAIHEIGPKPQALILGEMKGVWVDPEIILEDGKRFVIDPEKLNPLGRIGSGKYASIHVENGPSS